MGEHDAKTTSEDKGVVVGDNKKHAVFIKGSGFKRAGGKRKVWLGALVLLVALTALVLGCMYVKDSGLFYQARTPEQPAIDPNASPEEVDAAVTAAREKKLEQLISTENSDEKKRAYQNELMLIYLQQDKQEQAQNLAKEIEGSGKTAASAAALADVYFAQGNYEQAAKYYAIAMERSPKPNSPAERVPYNDYANLKKQAEAEAAQ